MLNISVVVAVVVTIAVAVVVVAVILVAVAARTRFCKQTNIKTAATNKTQTRVASASIVRPAAASSSSPTSAPLSPASHRRRLFAVVQGQTERRPQLPPADSRVNSSISCPAPAPVAALKCVQFSISP